MLILCLGCRKAPFLDLYFLLFNFAAYSYDTNQFLHQYKNINKPNNTETEITLKNGKKTPPILLCLQKLYNRSIRNLHIQFYESQSSSAFYLYPSRVLWEVSDDGNRLQRSWWEIKLTSLSSVNHSSNESSSWSPSVGIRLIKSKKKSNAERKATINQLSIIDPHYFILLNVSQNLILRPKDED